MRKRRQRGKRRDLKLVHPGAAGIDIGCHSHWVAIDPEVSESPVREFPTYTADLNALADWLIDSGVQTVAMESTGVYWIPVFEVLEDRGLDVWLVDARSTKQVAGRKSDVSDCQWIQRLHSYGLLNRAFIPGPEIATLRSYMRQRSRWVGDAARAIQHMQKALELMNVKLGEVVSDVTGKTGMAIIESILKGDRDPQKLSEHRDGRCKRSREEIARALHGTWGEEHLFALEQALGHYRYLCDQIRSCDLRIDQTLQTKNGVAEPKNPPPLSKKLDKSPHPFAFDAKGHCFSLAGVDLTTIDGVGINTALTVLSEVGTKMSRWRSERAFGAWIGLAPNPRTSAGRTLPSRRCPNANRVANALRLSARGVANSKSALGAFYRRLRARIGAPKALTAVAYKIAKIIYRMLLSKRPYNDIGQAAYDERFRARRIRSLTRMARALGYQIIPEPEAA